MFPRQGFLLCVFPTLSTIFLASDGKTPDVPSGAPATESASEPGLPALFSWGDANGDGLLDFAAVSGGGTLQLLVSIGNGRFEDVTERFGLSNISNAALALWADYDRDGRLDLFVGAKEGASRLFHNADGVFVDLSEGSGLNSTGSVQSAQWLDCDGDGRFDLFVATAEKSELFHGLEGGFFEVSELPFGSVLDANGLDAPSTSGSSNGPNSGHAGGSNGGSVSVGGANVPGRPIAPSPKTRAATPRSFLSSGPTPSGPFPPAPAAVFCSPTLNDDATTSCLSASSAPVLGKLYPISANLFVATGGNVGIGTTSPAAKLEVAGTARVTDTLTLNPSGDQALNVSTGSIYKGGALFIHTKGGAGNTAVGQQALSSVAGGNRNTASGFQALFSNTIGGFNSAAGYRALFTNSTGSNNTSNGSLALYSNATGFSNTATGYRALFSNTTGSLNTATGYRALLSNVGNLNTASGYQALESNTTGFRNTADGGGALFHNTTGNSNTASGLSAIFSNTTGVRNTANGVKALFYNTTGSYNTVSGFGALLLNTTGSRNIVLGFYAGHGLTTGNDNIAIGSSYGVPGEGGTIRIGTAVTHTRTFIAGIRAVTTGTANAIPVLVDSNGQLGTVSSSRRFKKDIADMGDLTERLLELRPVVFHYKQEQTMPDGSEVPLEYGLIAEEVAEIFPDLVVYDEDGVPFTVKYHLLSSMLLNEMKKQENELKRLHAAVGAQTRELEEFRSRLAALEARPSPATTSAASSR